MDGSTTAGRRGSATATAVAPRGRFSHLRRRSFLGGLMSLVLIRSGRATAAEPSSYGHGYQGGYR